MANTVTDQRHVAMGSKKGCYGSVAISSYTQGGEVLSPGDFGLKSIEELHIVSPANGYALFGSTPDGEVTAYAEALVEAADGASVGTIRVLAVGY